MALFSRKKHHENHRLQVAEVNQEQQNPRQTRSLDESENEQSQLADTKADPAPTSVDTQTDTAAKSSVFDRANGPFDAAELDGLGKRLDAGSLWLPVIPQAQLQFSTDEQRKNILGVVYLVGDSALQLQAFAAPKSHGIWDQVRLDMRTSIAHQGGSSQEADGPFGKELMAMMPLLGTQNFAPHRFLGIDGPRWLLRATLYGRAGADAQAAAPLLEIFRNVGVNRGDMPLVPRSLLPLKLPHLPKP